jgi:hypothetical protein
MLFSCLFLKKKKKVQKRNNKNNILESLSSSSQNTPPFLDSPEEGGREDHGHETKQYNRQHILACRSVLSAIAEFRTVQFAA